MYLIELCCEVVCVMKVNNMSKMNHKSKNTIAKQSLVLFLSLCGIFIIGVVIITVSIFGVRQNQDSQTSQLEVYQASGTEQPTFRITAERELKVNESNKLIIELDTKGQAVNGAQIGLRFDPDKVRFNDVEAGTIFNTTNTTATLRKDTGEDGKVWMIYMWPASPEITYSSKGTFAKISFTPLKTDSSNIQIVCSGSFTSKVIVGIQNVLNCNNSQGLVLSNISGSGSGTGGGGSQNLQTSSQPSREPWCTKEYPERPTNLKATTGPKAGQVHLTWTKSQNTSHYTVTYGEKWMDFKYGNPNIGDTDQFDVNGLKPGVMYYFVVTAVNVCASSGYSDGASAYAGKSAYISSGSGATTVKPKATIAPTLAPITATATPAPYEVPPIASSSASNIYDDWDTDEWSNQPTPTPDVQIIADNNQQSGGSILLTLAKILPWIGLVVLVILGIMLVKFIRGGNDQELPPIPQNFNADGDITNQSNQPIQTMKPQEQSQDPLAPPFAQQ